MSGKRTAPLRVAVLASGRGSNLQAIIDGIEASQVQASIVAVISNKKDAAALERARKHGLKDLFVDPKPFAGQPDSREAYDRALLAILQQHDVELVLLAGSAAPTRPTSRIAAMPATTPLNTGKMPSASARPMPCPRKSSATATVPM